MMISNRRATTLFSRLLVVVLAAGAFMPRVAGAAVSKEDPATTAEMRKKLTDLRSAYTKADPKAYAKALQPLMKDAVAQPPAVLVSRYASLEVIAREGLDGLQPMIYRYAKSIFDVAGKVDARTIVELRGSVPLAQSLDGSVLEVPCAQVVRAALRDREFPPPDDLAGLSCFSEDPVIQGLTLRTTGISLPAHDACQTPANNLIYKLDLPSSIPSASISLVEVVNLPFPQVLTWYADYVGWKWVSVSRIQFSPRLPADAQSESFTVRVTTTTGVTDFPVAFPINRGIQQASCNTTVDVGIGNAQNRAFYGNGPRDPRVWSSATATGTGLPAGLSFAQGTGALAGHGVVTGTVQATALNGSVDISYTQNASPTTKRYSFVVTLRPEPVRAAQLAGVHEIQRGQAVLIQLPDGQGANGTYAWNMWANYQLPAGLSIVHLSNGWFISGTVDDHARLEMRTVTLVLTSAGQSKFLNLTFDCRRPVKIYTQNTILFPEDIVNAPLDCLPAWAIFPGPISYAACVAAFEILEEIFYNGSVHNNDADNEDRADILVNYINAQQYDIVALQEVWDGPQTDAELDHIVQDTSASYRIVQGAGPEFDLASLTFKINSGLLTLAKPVFNQPPTTDHVRVFGNAGGGSDSLSRKGFVATQMFVSDDPAEYLWVITTHTHAQEAGTRADQVQQIQDFITGTLGDTHPILLVGDLNIEADETGTLGPSSEYALMRSRLAGFQDVALGRGLMTDDWYHNAYKHQWDDEHPAKRIDYIMVKPGTLFDLDFDANDVNSIAIVNNDPLVYPGLCLGWALPTEIRCHYSDHFGLKAKFKFRQR